MGVVFQPKSEPFLSHYRGFEMGSDLKTFLFSEHNQFYILQS